MQGEPNGPHNRQRRKRRPANRPESRSAHPLAGQGMLFYKALSGHIGRHLELPEPFPDSSMVEQPAVNRFVVEFESYSGSYSPIAPKRSQQPQSPSTNTGLMGCGQHRFPRRPVPPRGSTTPNRSQPLPPGVNWSCKICAKRRGVPSVPVACMAADSVVLRGAGLPNMRKACGQRPRPGREAVPVRTPPS